MEVKSKTFLILAVLVFSMLAFVGVAKAGDLESFNQGDMFDILKRYPSSCNLDYLANYQTFCTATANTICKKYNDNTWRAFGNSTLTYGYRTFFAPPTAYNQGAYCEKRTCFAGVCSGWSDYNGELGGYEVNCYPATNQDITYVEPPNGSQYISAACCSETFGAWGACGGVTPSCDEALFGTQTQTNGCGDVNTQVCTVPPPSNCPGKQSFTFKLFEIRKQISTAACTNNPSGNPSFWITQIPFQSSAVDSNVEIKTIGDNVDHTYTCL